MIELALFPFQKCIHHSGKGSRPMKGTKEYRRFRQKEHLTRKQAIAAHCFDCMGFYEDGYSSCQNPDCALFEYMPKKGVNINAER